MRLALDHNFPISLVADMIERGLFPDLELRPVGKFRPPLHDTDDRELILELHRQGWDGLVTCDRHIHDEPGALAALIACRFVLVVVDGLGHDELRATGALMLHLPRVAHIRISGKATVIRVPKPRPEVKEAWEHLAVVAKHRGEDHNELYRRLRPTSDELGT